MMPLAWEACPVTVPPSAAAGAAASGQLRLEARCLAGARGAAVVAAPHPLYGGTYDNPVVLGIAEGLRRVGVGALCFNWRGVEGSQGAMTDSLEAAVGDYQAALAALARVGAPPLFAAGYSFGAGTALVAGRDDRRVRGSILLAPPLGMLRAEDLAAAAGPILIVTGDDDEYAPIRELTALVAGRAGVELEVIPGADHFFHFGGMQTISDVIEAHVAKWL